MKCLTCKASLKAQEGIHVIQSMIAGILSIPNIRFLECPVCNEKLFSTHEHKKIIDYVFKKESELIALQPIGDFISAGDAAKLLRMTKQAFSKNARIKRGFILSTKIDGRLYYLRKSVEQFKATNDGRFNLESNINFEAINGLYQSIDQSEQILHDELREKIMRFGIDDAQIKKQGTESIYSDSYLNRAIEELQRDMNSPRGTNYVH